MEKTNKQAVKALSDSKKEELPFNNKKLLLMLLVEYWHVHGVGCDTPHAKPSMNTLKLFSNC